MGSAASIGGAVAGDYVTKYRPSPRLSRGVAPGVLVAAVRRRFSRTGLGAAVRGDAEPSTRVKDVALSPTATLVALDHSTFLADQLRLHLRGTRDWVCTAFDAWLAGDAASTDKLFWLTGACGTGKSVAFAVLLDRQRGSGAFVAWHVCRHDDAAASKPAALVRSLSAMLCANVRGFEARLRADMRRVVEAGGDLDDMLPADLFAVLIGGPLSRVRPPGKPCVIGIDALDELPRKDLGAALALLAHSFPALPAWVKVFVTSREAPRIRAALTKKSTPLELKVDGLRNGEDVRAFLRHVARGRVDDHLSLDDVERGVEQAFPGVAVRGRLAPLAAPLRASREAYDGAMALIACEPQYVDLCSEIQELRPGPLLQRSESKTIDALFADAARAQAIVAAAIADEWAADKGACSVRHPKDSRKQPWVDSAEDPGLPCKARALEKAATDYGGDLTRLTAIARISLRFSCCERLLQGFRHLQHMSQWALLKVKNRFASPTPLGYRGVTACFAVPVAAGAVHIVEVDFNLVGILRAKSEARAHYEAVRAQLPELCAGLCAGTAHAPAALEAFVMKRLDNSALDAVVELLAAKAANVFLHARLLEAPLVQAGAAQSYAALEGLPAGRDAIYDATFRRCFDGDAKWRRCACIVALIVSAREPLRVDMARAVLGAAAFDKGAADLGALFPIVDGRLRVMHKSVADWLQLPARAGQSFYLSPDDVALTHRALARALEGALDGARRHKKSFTLGPDQATAVHLSLARTLEGALSQADSSKLAYAVAHVVYHQVRAFAAGADAKVAGADAVAAFEALHLTLRSAAYVTRRAAPGLRLGLAEDYADAIARAPQASKHDVEEWSKFARLYAPFIAESPHLAYSYARNFGHAATSCVAAEAAASYVAAAAAAAPGAHWVFANAPTAADVLLTKMASRGRGAAASLRHNVACVADGLFKSRALAIFNMVTGERLHTVAVDADVTAVALAEGDDALDAWFGDADGLINRCDALEGTCDADALRVLDGDGRGENCVVFVAVQGGSVVAGMGSKQHAVGWQSRTEAGCAATFCFDCKVAGRPEGAPTSTTRWSMGEPTWAFCLARSAAGEGILVSTHARTLKVWDAATGALAYAVVTDSPGWCAAAHPTEDRFLSGHRDHVIREWLVGDDVPVRTIQDKTTYGRDYGGHWAVAYSSTGAVVSAEVDSRSLRVWDARGKLAAEYKGHRDSVSVIHAVRGSLGLVLSCDRVGDTILWQLPRPAARGTVAKFSRRSLYKRPEAGVAPKLADFSKVAWCGFAGDDVIIVVDAETRGGGAFAFSSAGDFEHIWTQPCGGLGLGRWSAGAVFTAAGDEHPTIAVSGEMRVALLDAETGDFKCDALVLLSQDDGELGSIAVNAAGILVGAEDRGSRCVAWDCIARAKLATYEGHHWKERVLSCDVSAAGLAVTAGHSVEAHVWDARTGDCLFIVPGHGTTLARWLDATHVLLDAETPGAVAVVDIDDGDVRVLEIHKTGHALSSLVVVQTDQGPRLLIAGEDGTVRLHDVTNDASDHVFAHHRAAAYGCVDAQQNGTLVVASTTTAGIFVLDRAAPPPVFVM